MDADVTLYVGAVIVIGILASICNAIVLWLSAKHLAHIRDASFLNSLAIMSLAAIIACLGLYPLLFLFGNKFGITIWFFVEDGIFVLSGILLSIKIWKCSLKTALRASLPLISFISLFGSYYLNKLSLILEGSQTTDQTPIVLMLAITGVCIATGLYIYLTEDESLKDYESPANMKIPFWYKYDLEPIFKATLFLLYTLFILSGIMLIFSLFGSDPLSLMGIVL
jgi:hypothetical protein